MRQLRRGREAYLGDERVLGSPAFVAALQRTVAAATPAPAPRVALDTVITRVCRQLGISEVALTGGGRRPALQRARAGIAYFWVERLRYPGRPLASVLGGSPQVVYQAVTRGRVMRREWEGCLPLLIALLGTMESNQDTTSAEVIPDARNAALR